MKTIWRRQGDIAVPADDRALAALHAQEDGSEFLFDGPRGARNIKQLRMWWALCGIVAENDEHYRHSGSDAVSYDLKIKLRHVTTHLDRWGRLHVDTKSIAFESLTQADFNPLFKRAIDIVCEWIGNQPQEIQDRVNEIVADKRYEGMRR